jgi:hypothetical protein
MLCKHEFGEFFPWAQVIDVSHQSDTSKRNSSPHRFVSLRNSSLDTSQKKCKLRKSLARRRFKSSARATSSTSERICVNYCIYEAEQTMALRQEQQEERLESPYDTLHRLWGYIEWIEEWLHAGVMQLSFRSFTFSMLLFRALPSAIHSGRCFIIFSSSSLLSQTLPSTLKFIEFWSSRPSEWRAKGNWKLNSTEQSLFQISQKAKPHKRIGSVRECKESLQRQNKI